MEEKRLNMIENVRGYLHTEYAEKIITAVVSFFAGLLCSRGLVFGRYSPFGVAVTAAVPRSGMWAAALGAFIGYIIPSPVYVPARYGAAIIAVVAIRWSLSELKSLYSHSLFAPIVTFVPMLLTGMVMVLLNGSLTQSAALYTAEAFLGAGCAYFLTKTSTLISSKRRDCVFDNGDVASACISAGIIALAFSAVTISGISLGRVAIIVMVLYCARIGGISAGTVAGVAAGVIQGFSTAGLSYLSGAYGLGGLMAGVFAPMGKIATAVAFIISHGIASLQVGDSSLAIAGAIEAAVATVIYMILPKSQRISHILNIRKEALGSDSLRGNIVMRLTHASRAITGIYESVGEISKKLLNICAPDIQGVFNSSTEKICGGCPMSQVCWRKNKEETLENFTVISSPLKENGKMSEKDFRIEFQKRCVRINELTDEINKNYTRYLIRDQAEIKAAQVREIVEEHFKTTSGILDEMAAEFSTYHRFDDEAAERVWFILEESGLTPIEVCCRIDQYDRMTVEAEIKKERQSKLNRATFAKEISAACGRSFCTPCFSSAEDRCKIQISQKPLYDAERGFSQISAKSGSFCGDSSAVFYDGCGRLIAIVSDGMGTGGRAAVDGAMACAMAESLLKAGIGFESMLQTVNAALMAKSGDESLATMDIACIDLFTGKGEIKKAGGAGTVIRRAKSTEYIETVSMPLGIMPNVSFTTSEIDLCHGDMLVLVTDGVVAQGSEWLVDFVENCDIEQNPNHIAEQITLQAKRARADGREDDITALVLIIS